MSAEYMDVLAWKKTATGKNFAVKLGSAKKLDNGNIAVYLDALPIPGPDGCQITIAPQRPKTSGGARTVSPDGLDDGSSIPF
jgi:hypothetical protein